MPFVSVKGEVMSGGANKPLGKPPSCIDLILEESGYCQEATFVLEGEIGFWGTPGRGG